jgi:hypothetical protein
MNASAQAVSDWLRNPRVHLGDISVIIVKAPVEMKDEQVPRLIVPVRCKQVLISLRLEKKFPHRSRASIVSLAMTVLVEDHGYHCQIFSIGCGKPSWVKDYEVVGVQIGGVGARVLSEQGRPISARERVWLDAIDRDRV